MARRLTITPSKKPVMTIYRRAIKRRRLVYIICTPRPHRYPSGRSRIIYIGTTGKGVHRVASSMSHKAIEFLVNRGVKSLDVHVVTCLPRPGIRAWLCLERDLLITFKLEFGSVPLGNSSGKNFVPDRLSQLFQYRRMVKVVNLFC
jgi:hypothetical protein